MLSPSITRTAKRLVIVSCAVQQRLLLMLMSCLCRCEITQQQMGGKEAAAIIRQHNKHVPIIFLTGEIAASMKESTKEFAPSRLLLKPCNKVSLIAVSPRVAVTTMYSTFVLYCACCISECMYTAACVHDNGIIRLHCVHPVYHFVNRHTLDNRCVSDNRLYAVVLPYV
jgi:CheY-like chemotaxis protein